MLIYKIDINSVPEIELAGTLYADKYKREFFGERRKLELFLIEETAIIRQNEEGENTLLETLTINTMPPGFIGNSFPAEPGIHRHITVVTYLDFDFEVIESKNLTNTEITAINEDISKNHTVLLPHSMPAGDNYQAIKSMMRDIAQKYTMGRWGDGADMVSLWFKLTALLTNECARIISMEHTEVSPSSLMYANNAVDFIKLNYARKFKIEEIAEYIGITPTYLQHVFKSVFGCSIIDYTNNLRIEIVKEYLKLPGASAAYAAKLVGIDNACYLSRLFKKTCKMSIHDYKIMYAHDENVFM